jgi:nucleoid DNA-binding protein
MTDRLQKKDMVQRLARRMGTDEQTAAAWLGAFIDTLYEAFKQGQSVTLPGFGGFYIQPRRKSWVFKFNPSQRLRALFGWSSSYKGEL